MGLCWCDSGTGSPICSGFGTGMWQWYESTPVADIAVNRHHSGIISPESYRTSKYPQLIQPRLYDCLMVTQITLLHQYRVSLTWPGLVFYKAAHPDEDVTEHLRLRYHLGPYWPEWTGPEEPGAPSPSGGADDEGR